MSRHSYYLDPVPGERPWMPTIRAICADFSREVAENRKLKRRFDTLFFYLKHAHYCGRVKGCESCERVLQILADPEANL